MMPLPAKYPESENILHFHDGEYWLGTTPVKLLVATARKRGWIRGPMWTEMNHETETETTPPRTVFETVCDQEAQRTEARIIEQIEAPSSSPLPLGVA